MRALIALSVVTAVAAPANPPAFQSCPIHLVASRKGENHVMFHGVSPDGRTLAVGWDRGSDSSVERGAYLLDLRTGRRTQLRGINNAPSFSPDGRLLVSANYSSDRQLRTEVVELDRRTGRTRSYASSPAAEWLASYSADGKWILFNSTRSGSSDLYRVRRSDGRIEQVTSDPRYEAHAHYFGRDGKLIFHRQTDGDNYDIVIRDVRTGQERLIGATPAEEAYPAVSPDGRWIAFSAVTGSGAEPHLFIMRADGSGRRQLTNDSAKDAYSAWAPNGRALHFVRFESDGSKIYRLAMRNGVCVR